MMSPPPKDQNEPVTEPVTEPAALMARGIARSMKTDFSVWAIVLGALAIAYLAAQTYWTVQTLVVAVQTQTRTIEALTAQQTNSLLAQSDARGDIRVLKADVQTIKEEHARMQGLPVPVYNKYGRE